ncbi:MAG: hypothetical protein JXA07_12690 [Spirochaetes bacterium]|nr:hypothetical protein [Spirochaetota bacterium]
MIWNRGNVEKVFQRYDGYFCQPEFSRVCVKPQGVLFSISFEGKYTQHDHTRRTGDALELLRELESCGESHAERIFKQRIEGKHPREDHGEEQAAHPKKEKKKGRPKASKQVLDLANGFLLCKCSGTPYIIHGNQAIEIGSGQYKDFISRIAYTELGITLSDNNIREIQGVQRGEALYAGSEHKVFTRVASISETLVYIDLNDGTNTIIEIRPGQCRIAEHPQVFFYRPPHSKPLPMPELPGDIELLKEILTPIDEKDYKLLRSVLCFYEYGRPSERGTFPITNFEGPAGSLKTTKSKICKYLIDPGKPEGRTLTKDIKDLFIYAKNQYVLHFDNVSHIDAEHQDALCSLASQGGYGRKKNYTDDDETVFEESRPIITNGIEYRAREDLQSRKIDIECKAIDESERLTERQVWEKVERLRPAVLGGILTAISRAMNVIEHGVNVEGVHLPRLADFAIFSLALERGNDWKDETIDALKENYKTALSGIAGESPLYDSIKKLIMNKPFTGTAKELLECLEIDTDEKIVKSKQWPGNPAKLGRWITRNEIVLNSVNIQIKKERSKQGDRIINLELKNESQMDIPF